MPNPNPKTDHLEPYKPKGEKPLSEKPLQVRVEREIYDAVSKLPNRAEWLRRVITEAAKKELMIPF